MIPASATRQAWARAATCAALGGFVFCLRAWLLRGFGSDLPFWDQWNAEAGALYLPWLRGQLGWSDLFQAHNEHRIVLTRLTDLALFVASHGWNPWAELLVNAALHAGIATLLCAIFWRAGDRVSRPVLVTGLAVLFAATAGWQNALWGFQSQVYFTTLLSLVAVVGLVGTTPGGLRWFTGWAAAALALFAGASGVLAALAVLPFVAWPAWRLRRQPVPLFALAAVLAVIAAGLALQVDPPHHAALHARGLSDFAAVFARCLAWPHVDSGWLWPATQLPLAWLVFTRWRNRQPLDRAEQCALALGLLAILHAAAVAYSRGAGLPDHRPLSRYQDPLLPGVAAQLFAALRLAGAGRRSGRLVLLGWSATVAAGLIALTATNLSLHLPYKRAQDLAGGAALRRYLATGDAAAYLADPGSRGLHPTDPAALLRVVDEPLLRPLLPASLRTAPGVVPPPPPWPVAHAPPLAALAGAVLLALLVWRHWPSETDASPLKTRAFKMEL